MSQQPLWLRDLVAYSIQAGVLVVVGVVMARALRLRAPRVRLAYWQALLALCLFLPLLQPWQPEVLVPSGAVVSSVTLGASVEPVASPSLSLAEMILLLICTGIAARAAWIALGLARLWLYRRQAQLIEQTPQAVAEAQRLAPVFPDLFISRQLRTPATFGFLRPAILFPTRFLEMEPAMQKAIALHELLHVERRDWLWNLLEEAVLTPLWFHVPLWWVVRSARLSREQVVDAEAVRRSNARRPYLKALLEMAGQKSLAESLPAPLFLRESQLAERVALMMKEAHMSRTRLTVSMLTAAGVLLIAGASVVWTFPLRISAQNANAPEMSSAVSGAERQIDQNNKKADATSQKSNSAIDPAAQAEQSAPDSANESDHDIKINQAEIQRQIERALDQAKIAQEAAAKVDQKRIQRQLEQAIRQAKIAQQAAAKLNEPEIRRQLEQAMQQAKIAQQATSKIDEAKIRQQLEQAMQQAKIAQQAASKLDKEQIKRQIRQAMRQSAKQPSAEMAVQQALEQAKIAQQIAGTITQAEIQRQVEQAMKQAEIAQQVAGKISEEKIREKIDQAMKQAQIQRQEAEKARQQAKRDREEGKKQRKEVKPPLPPSKPAPLSPKEAAPPASPPPPPPQNQ